MVALGHSTRLLRFLLILIAVVVTIFVYTTYSTNSTSFSPTAAHLRDAAAALAPSESLRNRINDSSHSSNVSSGSGFGGGIGIRAIPNDPNEVKINKKFIDNEGGIYHKKQQQQQTHHREPTIDEDAIADNGIASDDAVPDDVMLQRFVNNDLLEEQYVQNVDNNLGNINNSNMTGNIAGQGRTEQQQQQAQQQSQNTKSQQSSNNNNLNKIPDSDVLIPTSNLQKFIENADKILKNVTMLSSSPSDASIVAETAAVLPGNSDNVLKEKQQKESVHAAAADNNKLDNNINDVNDDEALPPSAVMTIKRVGEQAIITGGGGGKRNNANVNGAVKIAENKAKIANATTPHSPDIVVSRGILTENIYESGHRNDEINIEKICPDEGRDLKLLILITSAPSHFEARLAIRQTWGHYGTRRDVSTAFILGRTINESLKLELAQENFIYGDLIRGNFIDSYNNLTLKTISSLEWVDRNCPNAKYILKTDDDMFINVPKLLGFLNSRSKERHVIYGRLAKKWKPIRNKKSKYYVSQEQFAQTVFPPFTTGPAYVLSSDTIHDLYERSLKQVYLKLEDVFTTGIIAQDLKIKRVHVNEFLNRRIAFNPCNIRKTISVHMIKSNEQFDLWKKLLDQTTKCK